MHLDALGRPISWFCGVVTSKEIQGDPRRSKCDLPRSKIRVTVLKSPMTGSPKKITWGPKVINLIDPKALLRVRTQHASSLRLWKTNLAKLDDDLESRDRSGCIWETATPRNVLFLFGFVWKCWVYSQWNSHLIGIMISKTIGFRGTQHFQTHPFCYSDDCPFSQENMITIHWNLDTPFSDVEPMTWPRCGCETSGLQSFGPHLGDSLNSFIKVPSIFLLIPLYYESPM